MCIKQLGGLNERNNILTYLNTMKDGCWMSLSRKESLQLLKDIGHIIETGSNHSLTLARYTCTKSNLTLSLVCSTPSNSAEKESST